MDSPRPDRPTPRVLLCEGIHPDAAGLLRQAGCEVDSLRRALGEDELIGRIAGVDLLGIRSGTRVSRAVVEQARGLVAVGAFCIGTNQVDLPACTEAGVAVFNAPFSNTRSVVELALAEIIALTRRLFALDRAMQRGAWDKSATGSHEIRGRRLGIVGYGNIGTQLSVLAEALGMSVWFYDTADRLALGNARRCSSLKELLEEVDVVTLHVDGRPANQGFFGEDELALMRPGSLFLNLSRGFVVDHGALRRHLESGHLAGAAVDVFPDEPAGRGEAFASELQGLPNVVLTPHIGGSTEEAQQDIGNFVAAKLADHLSEGSTSLSVNLPSLSLPDRGGSHRIAHLHRNTPGVLAAINGVLAGGGLNVEGQHLATRGDAGYVVTDVSGPCTSEMVGALTTMEATIRVRLPAGACPSEPSG
ncbi:MAG: phosphoglycerate dehydrogenase [Acidimicrobiales bacterium]